jgi:hypothetical protein
VRRPAAAGSDQLTLACGGGQGFVAAPTATGSALPQAPAIDRPTSTVQIQLRHDIREPHY